MGLNLYRGFESLGLRQLYEKRPLNLAGVFLCEGDQRCPCGHRVWDSKGLACKPSRGLRNVGESPSPSRGYKNHLKSKGYKKS